MSCAVAGTGMTRFAKHRDRTLRDLVREAVAAALEDAGVKPGAVEAVYFGNAAAGVLTGQEMVRGQVLLQDTGVSGVPVVNVENACASSSTAAHLARRAILAGDHACVLVVGAEKMVSPDRSRPFRALAGALDVERAGMAEYVLDGAPEPAGGAGSVFMDVYAEQARAYMARTGATAQDIAAVAAKTRFHGSLNPRAQYREAMSIEQVLAGRMISDPLTLPMCSPIGDGAAALVLTAGDGDVAIRASALGAGVAGDDGSDLVARVARRAYEQAGVGPSDVDVVELHDAAASAELLVLEELGICGAGEAPALVRDGGTRLGGRVPVNTGGGLIARGHPIGATGAAQLVELCDQLRGRAAARQVDGARIALAENAGGHLGADPAACVVTILEARKGHPR